MKQGLRRCVTGLLGLSLLAAAGAPAAQAGAAGSAAVPIGSYVAYTTCGFPRMACAASDLGGTSAAEPAPQTSGNFVEVSVSQYMKKYGADGIVPQPAKALSTQYAKLTAYGQGGDAFDGYTFPQAFFPSTGQFTADIQGLDIPFLIPRLGLGVPSILPMASPNPITLTVPPAHYLVVWLLETGINGSQEVSFLEHYSDGSSQYVSATFPDWCNGGSAPMNTPPAYIAIWLPYRLNNNGGKDTNVCGGFYAEFLPTLTSKVLTSITLSNIDSDAFIMSVTLQKTT